MGKGQIILIVMVALGLLALAITTWGSVGSAMCIFCLILMVAVLLYRKFVLDRDTDDFEMEM